MYYLFRSKILSVILTTSGWRKSSDNVLSHCLSPLLSREGQEKSSLQEMRARVHSRWWNVRKCAAWSWLHARVEFIVPGWRKDCARPAVGNCHSRQPARRPLSNELFRCENFRSDAIFSFPRNRAKRPSSFCVPSSHFTKLSSVVRNVNFSAKALIYRATVHRH